MIPHPRPQRHRAPRVPAHDIALVVVLVVALGGCGSAPSPSSSPNPSATAMDASAAPSAPPVASSPPTDPLAVYAAIASDVEQIRGLQPTKAITPVLVDEARLRTDVTTEFDTSNPPDVIGSEEAILRAFGLLGPATSLRAANIALMAGQVAGYYDPEKGSLFVVSRSGAIGPMQRATYAHEFTHQLQDQHFGLDKLGLDAHDQGDRSLARLALVEGDASAAQTTWIQQHLSPAELAQLLVESSDPTATRALNDAPAILRATSLFPYQQGLAFVSGMIARGGFAAVDAAFARPPDSTEQVLHPEKYDAREAPVVVALPVAALATRLGTGWTAAAQDTLGELVLRTWLGQSGITPPVSSRAAAGWGGDRVALLDGPGGSDVVVLGSVWDTPTDADEFGAAATSALRNRGLAGAVVHAAGSPRVVVVLGGSDAQRTMLEGALGF